MKTTMLFVLFGLLLCKPVYAQNNVMSCWDDIQQYCAQVKPGGGAILACLKKNETSLSRACNQYQQTVRDKLIAFVKACNSDIKTHCATVLPGGGRVYACLEKNEADLGATCKNQLTLSTK